MVAIRPPKPSVNTYQTADYLKVLKEADTRSGAGLSFDQLAKGSDKVLSKEELDAYGTQLDQRLQILNLFGTFFKGNVFGQFIQAMAEDAQKKKDIAGIMSNNFDRFADINTDASNQTISAEEIQKVAQTDGNGDDITLQDVTGEAPVVIDTTLEDDTANPAEVFQGNDMVSMLLRMLAEKGKDLEPESDQARSIQNMMKLIGQFAPQHKNNIDIYAQKQILYSSHNLETKLLEMNQTAEAESPQAIAIQARLAALKNIKQQAKDKLADLRGDEGSATKLIPGNDQVSVMIRDLLTLLKNIEPESPQAAAITARLEALGQIAPQHKAAIKTLLKNNTVKSLDNVLGSLTTILANLEPSSTQAIAIKNRIEAINLKKDSILNPAHEKNNEKLIVAHTILANLEPTSEKALKLKALIEELKADPAKLEAFEWEEPPQ